MAQTWLQRRLAVEKSGDEAIVAGLGTMAADVGRVILRYASASGTIPKTRSTRDDLVGSAWVSVVKPYFVGGGDAPLAGASPQSPYTQTMASYIRQAVTVQADYHHSVIRKYAAKDPVVLNWLTRGGRKIGEMSRARGSRPDVRFIHLAERGWGEGDADHHDAIAEMEGDGQLWYDPYHLFVYGDSPYRLSDRVWRTAIDVRANIDRALAYHIQRGTAAVDIAKLVEGYLTPGERPVKTRTPYGVEGSYSARRLARTEITAAGGRSFLNAAAANPYVDAIKWSRTAYGEACPICDPIAQGGPAGDGVYAIGDVPLYPAHPHCMCNLTSEIVANPAAVTAALRAEIDARTDYARTLEGAFNETWLIEALLYGWFAWNVVDKIAG